MNNFAQLLKELGEFAGIADLAPDEDGGCTLMFDDFTVHMLADEEKDTLLVYSVAALVPPMESERFLGRLLEANAFYGETFGASFSVRDGAVYLQQLVPLGYTTPQRFFEMLETFLRTLAVWRELLNSPTDGVTESGPAMAPADFNARA